MSNPPWVPQWVTQNNIPFKRALCHDGYLVEAGDTQLLISAVTKYLRAIDYRPPNFRAYFETAVCRAIPPECGVCKFVDESAPADIRAPRVLRMADMLHFLEVMAKWLVGGAQTVSQEKAQERAGVCLRCPENQQVGGCSGCVDFAGKIAAKLGPHRVRGINDLQGCACCGCSIAGLIWIPVEHLEVTDEPSWCWKRTERV